MIIEGKIRAKIIINLKLMLNLFETNVKFINHVHIMIDDINVTINKNSTWSTIILSCTELPKFAS